MAVSLLAQPLGGDLDVVIALVFVAAVIALALWLMVRNEE